MAAYHRDDDYVTCGLTARRPGSAPTPMLGIEYGITLPLPLDSAGTHLPTHRRTARLS